MNLSDTLAILWLLITPLTVGSAIAPAWAGTPGEGAYAWGRMIVMGTLGLALWSLAALLFSMPRLVFLTLPLPFLAWRVSCVWRGTRKPTPRARGEAGARWTFLLFSPVLILAMIHVGLSLDRSIVDSDEALIWNLKAKKINAGFAEGWESSREMPSPHDDYPLLNPLLQNAAFFALGRTEHQICRLPIQVVGIALLLMLLDALPRSQRYLAPLFALPLVVDGLFWAGLRTAYSDHLVAAGLLLYAVEKLRYHRNGQASAALSAGLGAAFAAAAKNEGGVWVGIFLLAELLSRRPGYRDIALVLPALAVMAAGRLANFLFGFESDLTGADSEGLTPGQRLWHDGFDHLKRIAAWWPEGMSRHPVFFVFPLALPAAAFLLRRRAFLPQLRSLTLGLCLAPWVLIAVYLVTPHDLEWHLSTSAARVMAQLLPLALFWLAQISSDVAQTTR
jgi:hypothetical protein